MDEDAPYSEDEADEPMSISPTEKTHDWGPPLTHSTSTPVDTVNPLNVPRLADKLTEAVARTHRRKMARPLPPHHDDDQPSYRSIEMVVMEYIDGETLAEAKPKMNEETMKKV